MKHKGKILELPFPGQDSPKGRIQHKILELQARKEQFHEDAKKVLSSGSRLLLYYEEKNVNAQIELLNWIIGEK